MNKPTFFEQLGIADMERIHSQMISWMFSQNFEGFNNTKATQINLLNEIFELNITEIETSVSEVNAIDILIKCDNTILIIENKIKTSQHSDQLVKYQGVNLDLRHDQTRKYYYLTLCEEPSNNITWANISYSKILICLRKIENEILQNFHGMALQDYIQTINKFTSVAMHFISNTHDYDTVFKEGNKTKMQKLKIDMTEPTYQNFIRRNQLETILQKHYFQRVRALLNNPEEYFIVETNGNAILGRHIVRNIEIDGKKYHLGMDFQMGTFKTMIIADDYKNSLKEHFNEYVHSIYQTYSLSSENKGYKHYNKPTSKAHISLTNRRLKKQNWWHLTPHEFANEFEKEVLNTKEMIDKYFLPKLNNQDLSKISQIINP